MGVGIEKVQVVLARTTAVTGLDKMLAAAGDFEGDFIWGTSTDGVGEGRRKLAFGGSTVSLLAIEELEACL